jgi:hypothetical protein
MTTPIQTINLGSYPNDGTGDDLRTAFTKVNTNFNTLFTEGAIVNGTNLGTGVGVFADKNNTTLNLEFKSLTSDASVNIVDNGTNIHFSSVTTLSTDTNPSLTHDLNLNGHNVVNGDTQTTIFGYDLNALNSVISGQVASSQFMLDFGSIVKPTGWQRDALKGYSLDLNGTGVIDGFSNPLKNDYDFGVLAVDNFLSVGGYKLTLNANLTVNGGNYIALNSVGNSNLTLPTRGTLATTSNTLNQFSATTSIQLLSVIADPSGSGKLVFNNNAILTGTTTTTNISASGYIYVTGNFAVNGTKFEVDAATGNTVIKGNLSAGTIISPIPAGDPQIDVGELGNNRISLTVGQTVQFPNFSGSVMVNCWNSGTVTQYLCGGGGAPRAIGSSKVTNTGTMASNGGINGYTFTATEAGTHTFYVVKTRPGA